MSTSKKMLAFGSALAITLVATSACANEPAANGEAVVLQFAAHSGALQSDGVAYQAVFDAIKDSSGGTLTIEPYWDGALLPATEMLSGVADGRADIGHLIPLYYPGELPLSQISSVPFVGGTQAAGTTTFASLFDSNEAFQNEFSNNDVRPLTFYMAGPSALGTSEPVTSVDDLQGLAMRGAGMTGTGYQMAGANVSTLQFGEIYESLERGLIDGYSSVVFDSIGPSGFYEVAPHVTDTGTGSYALAVPVINASAWEGLSDEHQEILAEEFSKMFTKILDVTVGVEDEVCDTILEAGGTVTAWDETEKQRFEDLVAEDLVAQWKDSVPGDVDADTFYADFQQIADENDSGDSEPNGMERCAAK